MKMIDYGICDCGKWGLAPAAFNESKHFLKCPACSKPMYLSKFHNNQSPRDLGYPTKDEVTITELIKHKG